jgi:ATP-dependent DNA helicase RecG
VALMAPTEILAEQHARTAESLLSGLDVRIDLLTGSVPAARRRQVLEAISSGTAQLVIGTHALIQETVTFSSLGLAIIDEQHRFGVRQRLALSERAHEITAEGAYPDVLVMSATPIPRSLALTLHGDLDLSILDERPPGRRPVRTALRSAEARQAVHDFIREQVRAGRQAYLVYPLVEESESLEILAATSEFERLRFEVFPELKLGLLHGQMAAEEKDRVMREFSAGTIDILVATTVIEVGIDVPNATVMVIEHAERFGLSQLHQLRGRVGRGAAESYCILISERPETTVRLRVFRATEDGFRIAEEDLRIRGQGDLFGERQAGLPAFRWARLERDLELLVSAQRFGRSLVEQDPRLERHPELMRALQNHFERPADLLGTG